MYVERIGKDDTSATLSPIYHYKQAQVLHP
jgi:hypothetical protein